MKKLAIGLLGTSVLFLGGCIIIDADDSDMSYDYDSNWATVYAADAGPDTVSITVSDNGCTTKEFFEVDVDQDAEMEFDIGFDRIREDYCKMLNPAGKMLTWTYSELGIPGGAEVSIRNSVRR